jgi:predicted DNA-binding protein
MAKKRRVDYTSLHVDIPIKLKERLDRLADFDGRKLRWLVEELIRLGLEHYREKYTRLAGNTMEDPALKDDRGTSTNTEEPSTT